MFTEEQEKVIAFEKGNVMISASAGSGKTTVMIERLTRLIAERKAKVSEVLAITFTEAAASEMKERLKKKIIEKINEEKKTSDKKLTEENVLEKQLNEIRIADICTIDGYCARLIRSNFFALGISPDYEVADALKAEALKEEALTKVFLSAYKEKGEFLKYVDRFAVKRSDRGLKEIVLKTFDFLSTEPDEKGAVSKFNQVTYEQLLSVAFDMVKSEITNLKSQLDDCIITAKFLNMQKHVEFIEMLISDINVILSSESIYSLLKVSFIGTAMPRLTLKGERENECKEQISAVNSALKGVCNLYKDFLINDEKSRNDLINAKETAKFLFELSLRVKDEYDKLKREENVLDFSDLEHFALIALQDEKVLNAVKSKYKYVFVDEYQDVNGTEEAIITKLTDGNLFTVGDEKQSIYGFRGCRPEFFSDKFKQMEENGEATIKLNNNFRSSNEVIDFVNTVFSYSMTLDRYGVDYSKDARLVSGDGYLEHKGRANLHILIKDKKEKQLETPRIYDIKEEIKNPAKTEDNLNVSLLVKIINEELGKEYYDVKNKKVKKVTKGDICILSRSGNGKWAEDIIKGLISHGIDITSNTEEDVCMYPEAQSVINILRLVDCFYQDVPLLSVLKNYVVGLNENQLCDIVDYYKDKADFKFDFTFSDAFDYYLKNANGPLWEKLKSFKEYIDNVRFLADFSSAGEILEKVIEDFSIYAYLYAESEGDVKVERVERIVSYCYENSLSVSALLRIVDSGEKKITYISGGGENSVKFMTIHASKGLEFPIVIVCGTEKNFNHEDLNQKVLLDRELGLSTKTYDDELRTAEDNIFKIIAKERFLKKCEKEELRLFYVALTRASYALHITAVVGEDKRADKFTGAKKFIDFIPSYVKSTVYSQEDLEFTDLKTETRKVLLSQSTDTGINQTKRTFAFDYPYLSDTVLPLKSSVTAVNQKETDLPPVYELTSENESKTDTERGIIAHKIMQYFDFFGGNFESQIAEMIEKNILTEEEIEKINLEPIKNICKSDTFLSLKDKKIYKEKEFVVFVKASDILDTNSSENVLLQGIIDLLIIGKDGAEIIDYKYSKKSGERLKEDYKKQLILYAYAVENILNIPVKKKSIVSLLTGESIEID